MFFGSHVSISKGYLNAAKTAVKIGANAFQYFPKNPRTLSIKKFDYKDAENCARFSQEHGLLSIAHTPYPTNLAVNESDKKEIMLLSIINDLEIAEACGSIGVVIHFGKYKGEDRLQGYKNIIALLNRISDKWDGQALILIENQASLMGTTFEELVQIRNMTKNPKKIGYCFDTCHAFSSNLWMDKMWEEALHKGMELGYFEHVKAVHLNDSVYPNGSYHDRHANIGEGYIGDENMKDFLRSPFLKNIPAILETPQSRNLTHQMEIEMLYKHYV